MLILALALAACEPPPDDCVDMDGDGVGVGEDCDAIDCDDTDPDVITCGGSDSGDIELDDDGDGFDRPEDCDDDDPDIFPGQDELCDGIDNDCDEAVDEDAVDMGTWYTDSDSDGSGDLASPITACTQPAGTSQTSDDCDDTDALAHPGADEYCDLVDNDCDGDVDEDAIDPTPWYADTDADSYGDAASTVDACTAPADHVADATDCDDSAGAVFPGADELCNGIDDDCDGTADEDAIDAVDVYADADGDTYGSGASTGRACLPIAAGSADNDLDCDDTDPARNPTAFEYPGDGVDNDCDGVQIPTGDSPNDFYVSAALGDNTTGNGTMSQPYASIGRAVTASQPGDTIHIDAGVYSETLSAARYYIGSYDASSAWALDLTARSTVLDPAVPAIFATIGAGQGLTAAGFQLAPADADAVNVISNDNGLLVLDECTVSGRIDTTGVDLGLRNTDMTGTQFGLRVNGVDGVRAEVLGGTYTGTVAGAWFGGDALVDGATFIGPAGFLARGDTANPPQLLMRNVTARGAHRGGTLAYVDGRIEDSLITNDAIPGGGGNEANGLELSQGSTLELVRSEVWAGYPGLSASPYSFFAAVHAEDSDMTVVGSTLVVVAGFEANTHARGVHTTFGGNTTVINSSMYVDTQGGVVATGVAAFDGGETTVVNTALRTEGGSFGNNRGLWIDDTNTITLHHNLVHSTADSVLALQHTSGITALDAAGVDACDWAGCAAASVHAVDDVMYTDPFTGDLSPMTGSPLIDGGVDPLAIDPSWSVLGIDLDIDGNPRPIGSWDIGAYER